jgi:hypothetical protein
MTPDDSPLQRSLRSPTTFTGIVVLVIATVTCASDASAAAVIAKPGPRPATPNGAITSDYLGGFQDTPDSGLASASVRFTVPTSTCTKADQNHGAGMMEGVYTEGAGVPYTYAQVLTECFAGSSRPEYRFVFGTSAGSFVKSGAKPHNSIVTSFSQSGSSTGVEIQDLTTGATWSANDGTDLDTTYVNVGIMEYPGPIPTFATTDMFDAKINGDSLGADNPARYDLVSADGHDEIKCGTLNPTGTKFSLAFKPRT